MIYIALFIKFCSTKQIFYLFKLTNFAEISSYHDLLGLCNFHISSYSIHIADFMQQHFILLNVHTSSFEDYYFIL